MNVHFAHLIASLFNSSDRKKAGGERFETADFLLKFGRPDEPPPATVQEAFALIQSISRGKKKHG